MLRSTRRRLTFIALAIVLGAAAGLAIVEVAARAIPLITDKTMIPFREMPGDEAFAPLPSASARTLRGKLEETNRHGLRDPERSLTRPEHGPARVALLGDSVVWGFGLHARDAIPRRLEAELAGQGVPAEAWTLAHPATNMANHEARWRRLGPQVDADALVTFVVFNDLLPEATRFRVTPQGLLANPSRNAPYPDVVRPWIDRSAAYALALRAVYAWEQSRQPDLVYSLDNIDYLTASLGAVLASDPELPKAVVLVPGRSEPPEDYQGLSSALSEFSERHGALFLDLEEQLGSPARGEYMQDNDSTHPNDVGAERIARALAPLVAELLSTGTRSK